MSYDYLCDHKQQIITEERSQNLFQFRDGFIIRKLKSDLFLSRILNFNILRLKAKYYNLKEKF